MGRVGARRAFLPDRGRGPRVWDITSFPNEPRTTKLNCRGTAYLDASLLRRRNGLELSADKAEVRQLVLDISPAVGGVPPSHRGECQRTQNASSAIELLSISDSHQL